MPTSDKKEAHTSIGYMLRELITRAEVEAASTHGGSAADFARLRMLRETFKELLSNPTFLVALRWLERKSTRKYGGLITSEYCDKLKDFSRLLEQYADRIAEELDCDAKTLTKSLNTDFCYGNTLVEKALANLERSFTKLAEQLKKLLDSLTTSNFQTARNLVDNEIVETYKSILYEFYVKLCTE